MPVIHESSYRDQNASGHGLQCPDPEQQTCNTHACPTPYPTASPTTSPTPCPRTIPILNPTGDDVIIIECTPSNEYIDQGAVCTDTNGAAPTCTSATTYPPVDNIGVDLVDTSVVGCYNITYDCNNSYGISATSATRTVCVVDTLCPVCNDSVVGSQTVEASFPYDYAGLVCTDASTTLPITADVARSGTVNVERTGTYVVAYTIEDRNGNWNTPGGTCKGAASYTRTVVVEDTLRPIVHLKYDSKHIDSGWASDHTHANTLNGPAGHYYDTTTGSFGGTFKFDVSTSKMSVKTPTGNIVTYGSLMAEVQERAGGGFLVAAMAAGAGSLLLAFFVTRRGADEVIVAV